MREIPLTKGQVALVDDLDFDRISALKWRAWDNHGKPGTPRFYAITVGRHGILMHRLVVSAPAGMFVDHKSGQTLDNRRENLRICTPAENVQNSVGWSRVGYKGVYRHRSKFQAQIKINDRATHIGIYKTAVEAALAYDHAAKQMFGEFARLNFPSDFAIVHHAFENGVRNGLWRAATRATTLPSGAMAE